MCLSMPRKQANYRLDDRVIDAIAELAQDANLSANRYLEILLFNHAKERGKLPNEAKPLGETRGGDRSKPKKTNSTAEESDRLGSENNTED